MMFFYRLLRSYRRIGPIPEGIIHKGVIIGSASNASLCSVITGVCARFPNVHFTAYVFDWAVPDLAKRFPALPVEVINGFVHQVNYPHLVRRLVSENNDLGVLILNGEPGYDRAKVFGFLSGPRYLMVYNEDIASFYWTIGNWKTICHHLWRRANPIAIMNHGPSFPWWFNPFAWARNGMHLIGFVITGIGYGIAAIRVLPMIIRGWRNRNKKNCFFDS